MAEKLDQDQIVSFKELLISVSFQIDAVTQLLIDKGIFTRDEFFEMLKIVQIDLASKVND